jgi:hypothetical protein
LCAKIRYKFAKIVSQYYLIFRKVLRIYSKFIAARHPDHRFYKGSKFLYIHKVRMSTKEKRSDQAIRGDISPFAPFSRLSPFESAVHAKKLNMLAA